MNMCKEREAYLREREIELLGIISVLVDALEIAINTMNNSTFYDKQDNSNSKYAIKKANVAINMAKSA